MPGHGPPQLVCFLHQSRAVEAPGLEDHCHVEEVEHGLLVAVELPVLVWEGAQVGAVHHREGCQLTPAEKQLFGSDVPRIKYHD